MSLSKPQALDRPEPSLLGRQDRKRFRRGLTVRAGVGPDSIQSTLSWPDTIVQQCQEHGTGELFTCFLRRQAAGVHLFSQYSGLGGPEVGIDLLGQAVAKQCGARSGFVSIEAGDLQSACQHVLCNMNPRCRPKHVFKDVLDRLPGTLRAVYESVAPDKGLDREEMAHCHAAITSLLVNQRGELFQAGTRAPCALHGGVCPLYDRPVAEEGRDALSFMWAGPPCLDDTTMGYRATRPQHGHRKIRHEHAAKSDTSACRCTSCLCCWFWDSAPLLLISQSGSVPNSIVDYKYVY